LRAVGLPFGNMSTCSQKSPYRVGNVRENGYKQLQVENG